MRKRPLIHGLIKFWLWCNVFKVMTEVISFEDFGIEKGCLGCKKFTGTFVVITPEFHTQLCHQKELIDLVFYKNRNTKYMDVCKKPATRIVAIDIQPSNVDILNGKGSNKKEGSISESTYKETWISYFYHLYFRYADTSDTCVECVRSEHVLLTVPKVPSKLEQFRILVLGSYIDQNFKGSICQMNRKTKVIFYPRVVPKVVSFETISKNQTLSTEDQLDIQGTLNASFATSIYISHPPQYHQSEKLTLETTTDLHKEEWYNKISNWLRLTCYVSSLKEVHVAFTDSLGKVKMCYEEWYYFFIRTLKLSSPNKVYEHNQKKDIKTEQWWKEFGWLLKLHSVRLSNKRGGKSVPLHLLLRQKHSSSVTEEVKQIYENWYYNFTRILKLQTPNKLYQDKLQKDIDMKYYWETFSWLMKVNSVRTSLVSKAKSDELNRIWYQRFIFSLNLHCKNTQQSSDGIYEDWYYNFTRILKLQTPNKLYQEKLQKDIHMEHWWETFSWLMRVNSVRTSTVSKAKSDDIYSSWYYRFIFSLKLYCNNTQMTVSKDDYVLHRIYTPNKLYQETLPKDIDMENWWHRFAWLLKLSSVRSCKQRQSGEFYSKSFPMYDGSERNNDSSLYDKISVSGTPDISNKSLLKPEKGEVVTDGRELALLDHGGEVNDAALFIIGSTLILLGLLKAGAKQMFAQNYIKEPVAAEEPVIIPGKLVESNALLSPEGFQEAVPITSPEKLPEEVPIPATKPVSPRLEPRTLQTPAVVLAARKKIDLDLVIAIVDIYPWNYVDYDYE